MCRGADLKYLEVHQHQVKRSRQDEHSVHAKIDLVSQPLVQIKDGKTFTASAA